MSSHRIEQTSWTCVHTTWLYSSPTIPALVRSCNRVSQMQPPTAPHCIATKRKKPHKSLCGLGSWREQQQTIESTQKFACCQARPHRNLWGFVVLSSPDATQTIWIIHKTNVCQQVFQRFFVKSGFPLKSLRACAFITAYSALVKMPLAFLMSKGLSKQRPVSSTVVLTLFSIM